MADTTTESEVIQVITEWDLDLEVGSQVYQLPKDRKQPQEANL